MSEEHLRHVIIVVEKLFQLLADLQDGMKMERNGGYVVVTCLNMSPRHSHCLVSEKNAGIVFEKLLLANLQAMRILL